MKMKRKILAIWVILLLVTIPFGIVQASETLELEQNNETVTVELAAFESDEILTTETLVLSEKELIELESTVSGLIEKIQSANSWEDNNHLSKDNLTWRKLTPIECERLQTVPDNYTNHVSNSQRYKMLGNGWTVDVVAGILLNIKQLMQKTG